MIEAIGVIPARYSSTRFEGKVLADLGGKPVVQHVWEKASQAKSLNDLIIATDDQRVADVVKGFGAKVVLTSIDQPSGTDRLAEVVNPIDVKIIVNIQGDEPFVHPTMIDELVRTLLEDKDICMATVVKKITKKEELMDPNVVKVVIDRQGNALYFSRSPIPFEKGGLSKVFYKHLGIYAYTKDFLFTFTHLPKSNLEMAESLEQLRVLENNYKIRTIETNFDTVGIDTPEDLERAKVILTEDAGADEKEEPAGMGNEETSEAHEAPTQDTADQNCDPPQACLDETSHSDNSSVVEETTHEEVSETRDQETQVVVEDPSPEVSQETLEEVVEEINTAEKTQDAPEAERDETEESNDERNKNS